MIAMQPLSLDALYKHDEQDARSLIDCVAAPSAMLASPPACSPSQEQTHASRRSRHASPHENSWSFACASTWMKRVDRSRPLRRSDTSWARMTRPSTRSRSVPCARCVQTSTCKGHRAGHGHHNDTSITSASSPPAHSSRHRMRDHCPSPVCPGEGQLQGSSRFPTCAAACAKAATSTRACSRPTYGMRNEAVVGSDICLLTM